MGETAREAIIRMIGEIDKDVAGLDQQIAALKSRRWSLINDLDNEVEDTDEFEPVTPASQRPQESAWATLMREVVATPDSTPPPAQQPLTVRHQPEGYTPIGISIEAIDGGYVPTARVREINNPDDEPAQVHLLHEGSRRTPDAVALCGARAVGNYGWWNAIPENGFITLCLGCVSLMRSYR